jgi:hypothetical protein
VPRLSATFLELDHETKAWLAREYHASLVRDRKAVCGYNDKLKIESAKILCDGCFGINDVFVTYRAPDVLPETWKSDLANFFDDQTVASIAQDSVRCDSCWRNLNEDDALYVETVELAERLGISDDTDAIEPPNKRRDEVLKLYERKCFRCGSTKERLGIDHITPRSRGGNAAFENLQPLCEKCGNAKADQAPNDIVIVRHSARY